MRAAPPAQLVGVKTRWAFGSGSRLRKIAGVISTEPVAALRNRKSQAGSELQAPKAVAVIEACRLQWDGRRWSPEGALTEETPARSLLCTALERVIKREVAEGYDGRASATYRAFGLTSASREAMWNLQSSNASV